MLSLLKKLFRPTPEVNYKELLANGAQIIDVRTKEEFRHGHIKNSINIPLQNLSGKLHQLKKDKAIILCCASGIRSGSARRIVQAKGFSQVYNGGSWQSLQRKL